MARPVILALLVAFGLLGATAPEAEAQVNVTGLKKARCPDAKIMGVGMINKICWGSLFPIRFGGRLIFPAKDKIPEPEGYNKQLLCSCGQDLSKGQLGRSGFTIGFWQPSRAVEVVRQPYCMPLLGGLQLPISGTAGGERQQGYSYEKKNAIHSGQLGKKVFMNWNYYSFPLLQVMKIMDMPGCTTGGFSEIGMQMFSGFFPNWYDNELAFYLNPDVGLLTMPQIMAAQPVECAAVTATRQPIDKFWLTAGCWGNLPPYVGVVNPAQRVRAWSLLSSRTLSMLSRVPGAGIQRTTGSDVVCKPDKMPILKKSQYKFAMLFPIPEAFKGVDYAEPPQPPANSGADGNQVPEIPFTAFGEAFTGCAHAMGYPTPLWGEWRSRPATGEDALFLVWQWTDCCFGLVNTPGG